MYGTPCYTGRWQTTIIASHKFRKKSIHQWHPPSSYLESWMSVTPFMESLQRVRNTRKQSFWRIWLKCSCCWPFSDTLREWRCGEGSRNSEETVDWLSSNPGRVEELKSGPSLTCSRWWVCPGRFIHSSAMALARTRLTSRMAISLRAASSLYQHTHVWVCVRMCEYLCLYMNVYVCMISTEVELRDDNKAIIC